MHDSCLRAAEITQSACVSCHEHNLSMLSIVLGAGAMGSAATYYLSKAGQRVLLLDHFEIDHRQGSS